MRFIQPLFREWNNSKNNGEFWRTESTVEYEVFAVLSHSWRRWRVDARLGRLVAAAARLPAGRGMPSPCRACHPGGVSGSRVALDVHSHGRDGGGGGGGWRNSAGANDPRIQVGGEPGTRLGGRRGPVPQAFRSARAHRGCPGEREREGGGGRRLNGPPRWKPFCDKVETLWWSLLVGVPRVRFLTDPRRL